MPIVKETILTSGNQDTTIYIEVDTLPRPENYYEDLRGPADQVVDTAKDILGSGMKLIRTCAEQMVATIHKVDAATRPSEFEVQLSIKLDSEVGAVLAKASAEAQLQVRMKWVKTDEQHYE